MRLETIEKLKQWKGGLDKLLKSGDVGSERRRVLEKVNTELGSALAQIGGGAAKSKEEASIDAFKTALTQPRADLPHGTRSAMGKALEATLTRRDATLTDLLNEVEAEQNKAEGGDEFTKALRESHAAPHVIGGR